MNFFKKDKKPIQLDLMQVDENEEIAIAVHPHGLLVRATPKAVRELLFDRMNEDWKQLKYNDDQLEEVISHCHQLIKLSCPNETGEAASLILNQYLNKLKKTWNK